MREVCQRRLQAQETLDATLRLWIPDRLGDADRVLRSPAAIDHMLGVES
jgi:hypothetical protein